VRHTCPGTPRSRHGMDTGRSCAACGIPAGWTSRARSSAEARRISSASVRRQRPKIPGPAFRIRAFAARQRRKARPNPHQRRSPRDVHRRSPCTAPSVVPRHHGQVDVLRLVPEDRQPGDTGSTTQAPRHSRLGDYFTGLACPHIPDAMPVPFRERYGEDGDAKLVIPRQFLPTVSSSLVTVSARVRSGSGSGMARYRPGRSWRRLWARICDPLLRGRERCRQLWRFQYGSVAGRRLWL